MSTTAPSTRTALRMLVSMSATGAVIIAVGASHAPPKGGRMHFGKAPAGLLHAGDQPLAGHVAEADAADAELAVIGAGPPAQPAAQADADAVPRLQDHLARVLPLLVDQGQLALEQGVLRSNGHAYLGYLA